MALVHVVLCVAVVATLLLSYSSLRELSVVVDQQQRRAPLEERSQLTSGSDFVHVAERAIGHIEHLPQLGHHGQSEEIADIKDAGEDKLAASDVPDERVHGASLEAEMTNLPRKHSDVATSAGSGLCQMIEHTDYWGEALIWGPFNKKASAEECCKACTDYKPPTENDAYCNVWVWCGDKEACGEQYLDCWVKFLLHPVASKPKVGPQVPWTSGLMASNRIEEPTLPSPDDDRRFHIVTTAQGTPVHWQVRIHYYWYLKQKEVCEAAGSCMMGGFTRLLHSGAPDDLMDEIPTAVVDPLPPSVPGANQGYVVLNRPWAILQWMEKANIKEKYILMSEPDHVFLHPLINFMHKDNPAAFPFFYIEPARKDYAPITQKFLGPLNRKQLESIAPMGNSPTMLRTTDLKALAPHWYNLSISIFNDPIANKEWGWVMEMYAFTLACFKVGLKVDLRLEMMAQPPWDMELEARPGVPFYILHYTYGMDYTLAGEFTPGKFGEWRFDKRSYAMKPPPRQLSDPPDGMHNDLVRALIRMINEATDAIPGWDEYSITGTVHS